MTRIITLVFLTFYASTFCSAVAEEGEKIHLYCKYFDKTGTASVDIETEVFIYSNGKYVLKETDVSEFNMGSNITFVNIGTSESGTWSSGDGISLTGSAIITTVSNSDGFGSGSKTLQSGHKVRFLSDNNASLRMSYSDGITKDRKCTTR